MYEARFGPVKPLADDARVEGRDRDYRAFLGKRNPIVDNELKAMNAALSATAPPPKK